MTTVTHFPHAVRLIAHQWIPLADGCRLAARIWLPEGAESAPVPAVLEYIPYRKNDATALRDAPIHRYFAGHGYASVRVDLRGTGDSDGILEDEYLPLEQLDALEVLRWLAAQPWCTGSVGIIGKSWGGFNGLQIAAHDPPELRAVISVYSTVDRYAEDVHYIGGSVNAFEMLSWASVMLAYNARPPDPAVVGDQWRATWLHRLQETPPNLEAWMSHQRRDEFWKQGSVCEDYGALRCPVYMVGGWADAYRGSVLRFLEDYAGPCKGIIGPWGHVYPHDGAPGPSVGFLQEAVRWWDHWLKGAENGIMEEPKLRVYAQEAIRPVPVVETRPGRWVGEPAWPSPNVEVAVLDSGTSGRLVPESSSSGEQSVRWRAAVATDAGPWCGWGGPIDYAADQAAEDGQSLCAATPPLEDRLEILGVPVVRLQVAADRNQAVAVVRLCDVWPDGASTLVTRGVYNLTRRNGWDRTDPLVPGEEYTVEVALNAISYAVPAGHRLRVAISPGYWPIVWPSPEAATLTVPPGGISLRLPLRSAATEDPAPPDHFAEPEQAAPPPHVVLGSADLEERTHHRDAKRQVSRVVAEIAHFPHTRFTDSGLEYEERGRDTYEIRDDEPTSALCTSERAIAITRGDWRVRVETRSSLSSNATDFVLTNAVDAFEGDARLFAKTWHLTVPRDGC